MNNSKDYNESTLGRIQTNDPTNIRIRTTALDEINDEKNLKDLPTELRVTKVIAALIELGCSGTHIRLAYHGTKIYKKELSDVAIEVHNTTGMSYKDIVAAINSK